MRLRKPNKPTQIPVAPAPPCAKPAPRQSRRRLWIALLILVPLLGLAGWGAWALFAPDPLRDARDALDRREFRTADELLVKRLIEHPDDPKAQLLAARSARRAGEFTRASAHLRTYQEKHGADPAHELELRFLRAQNGDVAEAERLFADATAKPDAPDAPFMLEAYLEGKFRALAPRGASRAGAAAEEAALAIVEANTPNVTRAIDLWLAARSGRADQVQGRMWRARLFLAANKYTEGVAALREAVELDPTHLEARFQLALAVQLSNPDEARRQLEHLQKQHPENSFVRLGLANTYRMLGRGPDARRIYEGLLGGQHRADALVELGTLDMEEGNFTAAEMRLRSALEMAPNSPGTNIAMSRYYQLVGKFDEAAKYRKRFEELEAEQKKPRP
jgi:Tfp pilus assembly protein PilF